MAIHSAADPNRWFSRHGSKIIVDHKCAFHCLTSKTSQSIIHGISLPLVAFFSEFILSLNRLSKPKNAYMHMVDVGNYA